MGHSPNLLSLQVLPDGRELQFPVQQLINAGYTGRSREKVQAHMEELRAVGVDAPASTPVWYWKDPQRITCGSSMYALDEDCACEAEYVLLVDEDEIYATCGVDVFDKRVEGLDCGKSKHLYSNCVSPYVWRYQDLRERWDTLELSSWIQEGRLYQQGLLAELLPPDELMRFLLREMNVLQFVPGTVIFSGTIAARIPEMPHPGSFRTALRDRGTGAEVGCTLQLKLLSPNNL